MGAAPDPAEVGEGHDDGVGIALGIARPAQSLDRFQNPTQGHAIIPLVELGDGLHTGKDAGVPIPTAGEGHMELGKEVYDAGGGFRPDGGAAHDLLIVIDLLDVLVLSGEEFVLLQLRLAHEDFGIHILFPGQLGGCRAVLAVHDIETAIPVGDQNGVTFRFVPGGGDLENSALFLPLVGRQVQKLHGNGGVAGSAAGDRGILHDVGGPGEVPGVGEHGDGVGGGEIHFLFHSSFLSWAQSPFQN